MDKTIEYLNKYFDSGDIHFYEGPDTLFKYRPFDQYWKDMFENNYLFLCRAKNLDDKTECKTELTKKDIFDYDTDNLKQRCIEESIRTLIKPYVKEEKDYESIRTIIYLLMRKDHTISRREMLEVSLNIDKKVSNDLAPFVNWITSISDIFDNPYKKAQIEEYITESFNVRETTGVCSLSESNNVDDMWENYAGKETGYCVEYEVKNYKDNMILPVVYSDTREFNIVNNMLRDYMALFYRNHFRQNNVDITHSLRTILSKNTIWKYQKEWRIIGDPDQKIPAPRIKAVYLGKIISAEHLAEMKKLSEKYGFEIKSR